jgi:hypothetical protein
MKKLVVLLSVLFVSMFTLFMGGGNKNKKGNKSREGNIDEEMVGPKGEEIFVGANGGRYFLKDGKKIYVGYKGKKRPSNTR